MADWWTALDDEVLRCLERRGVATPAEIGRHVGLSETATASLLSFLVREGRVRICLVEVAGHDAERPGPGGIAST